MTINVTVSTSIGEIRPTHPYAVADIRIVADKPLSFLQAFSLPDNEEPVPAGRQQSLPGNGERRSATGWIAGAERCCSVHYGEGGNLIEVEGLAKFHVDSRTGDITRAAKAPHIEYSVFEEILLGAPLCYALLAHGTWSLHASAIAFGKGCALILGSSGDGKSTLAGWLSQKTGNEWKRLADDVVPCSREDNGVAAHFRFPQLKLSNTEQYPLHAPSSVPIHALLILDKRPAGSPAAIQSMGPASLARKLAEQTLACKLFNQELHERHLTFLGQLAGSVPGYLLHYPHDQEGLQKVSELLKSVESE